MRQRYLWGVWDRDIGVWHTPPLSSLAATRDALDERVFDLNLSEGTVWEHGRQRFIARKYARIIPPKEKP